MMSCVVSQSGVLVGEAFDVVGEFFVNYGFVTNHSHASCCFSQETGYQCCVGHLGITTMPLVLFPVDFCCQLPYQAKRGKDIIKFSVPFD